MTLTTVVFGVSSILILILIVGTIIVSIDEGRKKAKENEEEAQEGNYRSQEVIVYQYHLMLGILVDMGYAVGNYHVAGSMQHLLVRDDGVLIALNPFAKLDYSMVQLETIGEWFEREEPEMWEEAFDPVLNPVYKRSDTNDEILRHRVRYCITQYSRGEKQ